jgi:hypothetical protein
VCVCIYTCIYVCRQRISSQTMNSNDVKIGHVISRSTVLISTFYCHVLLSILNFCHAMKSSDVKFTRVILPAISSLLCYFQILTLFLIDMHYSVSAICVIRGDKSTSSFQLLTVVNQWTTFWGWYNIHFLVIFSTANFQFSTYNRFFTQPLWIPLDASFFNFQLSTFNVKQYYYGINCDRFDHWNTFEKLRTCTYFHRFSSAYLTRWTHRGATFLSTPHKAQTKVRSIYYFNLPWSNTFWHVCATEQYHKLTRDFFPSHIVRGCVYARTRT